MFPYTMLATTMIFYSNDWPKRVFKKLKIKQEELDASGKFYVSKLSSHCIYDKVENKVDEKRTNTMVSFLTVFKHNKFDNLFFKYFFFLKEKST